MKKLICVMLCLLIVFSAVPAVFSASYLSTYADNSSVPRNQEVTIYVSLSTQETVDNLGINVRYSGSVFEFVSAAWEKTEGVAISNYDSALSYGVIQFNSAVKPNGKVFRITLKAKGDAPIGSTSVGFDLTLGSGGEKVSASTSLQVSCAHKWSAWKTVTEATCTEIGVQERVCSECGTVLNENAKFCKGCGKPV